MNQRDRDIVGRRLGVSRSRRHVLGTAAKGTLGGVGAALVARGLGPQIHVPGLVAKARAQDAVCLSGEPLERKNVAKLSPPQIAAYRHGVKVMKARDPRDPTSWIFQANLHGMPAVLPALDTWCQHGSWFFLPWHRMYLYWFERILRKASGDPTLALPYWDYAAPVDPDPSSPVPNPRVLPEIFRTETDPAGGANPLFEARRNPTIKGGGALPGPAVSTEAVFDDANWRFWVDRPDFSRNSFGGWRIPGPRHQGGGYGTLEWTPHNAVHDEVGRVAEQWNYRREFPDEGTFEYRCRFHPEMTGTVVVSPTAPDRPEQSVHVTDFAFTPQVATIRVGARVRWLNLGEVPHTVTSDDGTFDEKLAPAGLMSATQLSPRDPIFWLHHANLDRLWNRWLDKGGDRVNPTDQVAWMTQEFTFFDEKGVAQPLRIEQVLNSVECLGYRYDDDPPAPAAREAPITFAATPTAGQPRTLRMLGESQVSGRIELAGEPVSTPVELGGPAEEVLSRLAATTPEAGAVAPQVGLSLEGVRDEGAPGVVYEIYVNLPPDVEPDYRNEYFVGLITLFGLDSDMDHDAGDRQDFDITRLYETLHARGEWRGDPVVTIVPAGVVPADVIAATPSADAAREFPGARSGPWVSIERITVSVLE